MRDKPCPFASIAWSLAFLGLLAALVSSLVSSWSREKEGDDAGAVYQAVLMLKSCNLLNEQLDYWVGDVAELYRLGRIRKDVAEADSAPLRPLVEAPRPFHGYFVRAMESGPSEEDWNEIIIDYRGKTRVNRTSAFCIYPAEKPRKPVYVYIVCPWGVFSKTTASSQPVLNWPLRIRDFSSGWAIVD